MPKESNILTCIMSQDVILPQFLQKTSTCHSLARFLATILQKDDFPLIFDHFLQKIISYCFFLLLFFLFLFIAFRYNTLTRPSEYLLFFLPSLLLYCPSTLSPEAICPQAINKLAKICVPPADGKFVVLSHPTIVGREVTSNMLAFECGQWPSEFWSKIIFRKSRSI